MKRSASLARRRSTIPPFPSKSFVVAITLAAIAVLSASSADAQITFGSPTAYAVPSQPWNVVGRGATGDFNRDGHLDVVVSNGVELRLMLGSGSGGFSSVTNVPMTGFCQFAAYTHPLTCVAGIGQVVAADVDNDGTLDVVTANNHSRNLSVLRGNGDGTFAYPPANYPMGWDTRAVAVGDLNNDGALDLVGGDSNFDIRVFTGTGSGNFSNPGVSYGGLDPNPPGVGGSPNRNMITIVDVDGDGNQDVVASNRDFGNVSVFPGNGDGTLAAATRTPQLPGGASFSLVEDFNGDGNPDIAVASAGNNTVSVFPGNGTFSVDPPVTYLVGTSPVYLASADLNGDGQLELVVTNTGGNNVSVLRGVVGGFFDSTVASHPTPVVLSVFRFPQQVMTGDLNGDGRPDIATVHGHPFNINSVTVMLNTTPPNDTTPPVISSFVSGTVGSDGWYTSDVTVTWTVTDPESPVTTSGCGPQTVTSDTNGVTFTCAATSAGGSASASATIKRDTTAPAIASVTADPSVLWAPNHKMRSVSVAVAATDVGSGLTPCSISSAIANEATNQHEPDVEIADALTLNLRAERNGAGSGRVYSIQVSCPDLAGNVANGSTTVTVPHDQRKE